MAREGLVMVILRLIASRHTLCFLLRWQKSQGAFVMAEPAVKPIGWERALMAAEKVKERLRRATCALDAAGVP
jgi:hypothetical protein